MAIKRTPWLLLEANAIPCECNTVGSEVIADGIAGIAGVDAIRMEIAAIDETNTELIDGKASVRLKFDYDDLQGGLVNKVSNLAQCNFVGVVFSCAGQCCPVSAVDSLGYPAGGTGSAEAPLVFPSHSYGGNAAADAPHPSQGPVGAPANAPVNSFHHEEFASSMRTWWRNELGQWQLIRVIPIYRDGNSVLAPDAVDAICAAVGLATYEADAGNGNVVNGPGTGILLLELHAISPATGNPGKVWEKEAGLAFGSASQLQTLMNDPAHGVPHAGGWVVDADGKIRVQSLGYNFSHATLYDSLLDQYGSVPFNVTLPAGGNEHLRECLTNFINSLITRGLADHESGLPIGGDTGGGSGGGSTESQKFTFATAGAHGLLVPQGAYSTITILAWGAGGGGYPLLQQSGPGTYLDFSSETHPIVDAPGGAGGFVEAVYALNTLGLSAGDLLTILVGSGGVNAVPTSTGGQGASGGGYSGLFIGDIVADQAASIVIAGGGGGASSGYDGDPVNKRSLHEGVPGGTGAGGAAFTPGAPAFQTGVGGDPSYREWRGGGGNGYTGGTGAPSGKLTLAGGNGGANFVKAGYVSFENESADLGDLAPPQSTHADYGGNAGRAGTNSSNTARAGRLVVIFS